MKPNTYFAMAMICLWSGSDIFAGPIEIQSNPVANGAIVVVGGNNDRSDWNAIPSYQADPIDASMIDYTGLQIAHDDDNIYIHLLLAPQGSPQFFGFMHNLFLDTDTSRSTGYFGSGGFLSTGSDYLIQGSSYFSFSGGTQDAFAWNFLGGVVWDDFPTNDIEIKIPRAALGSPDAFDIILNAATSPTEDYYPNGATAGDGGDFFRYSLVDVPEPTAATLMVLASCIFLGGRIRE